MSMFRLLRGEMHKILMRPILYVITGVLVLALFASVTLLNMVDRETDQYNISGATKDEVFQNFLSNPVINKSIADEYMSKASLQIQKYEDINSSAENSVTAQLKTLANKAVTTLNEYLYLVQNTSDTETNLSNLTQKKTELSNIIKSINDKLSASAQAENPAVLMEKADFDTTVSLLSSISSIVNTQGFDANKLSDHKIIISKLRNAVGFDFIEGASYLDKLETICSKKITNISVKKETLENLSKQYEQSSTYISTLYTEITAGISDENVTIDDIKSKSLAYLDTSKIMLSLVNDVIYYEPVSGFTDSKVTKYIGYANTNLYEVKQRITKAEYLLSNNLNSRDFANVFSSSTSFSNKVSAFDLVYFGLDICGFVILIFCVILAAGMIAGEQNSGTLKVLAIRPYSRSKILTSKILATLIFGLIFVVFSALVLFIVGYFQYGVDLTNILVVFNASSAFVISPIALIAIYIGLFLIKILFYVLLATMISVAFRSNIWAVAISIFIYFVSAIFSVLFTSSYWYAFVPFAGIDLFKFFGGNFVSQEGFAIALSSPLFYNSNFIISVVSVVVTMLVFTIISYVVFKKREIK